MPAVGVRLVLDDQQRSIPLNRPAAKVPRLLTELHRTKPGLCCLALLTAVATVAGGCAAPPTAAPVPPPPSSAAVGGTTVVAVAPAPAAPPPTLWDFLGITQVLGCVQSEVQTKIACLGYYLPWIEHAPPVLALTDPANLESANPAVAAAAAVKAEEDAAAQKIKALRYLATIGCGGCYPGVEEAFLAALDDCTEEVRYEAAKALTQTVGNPCKFCRDKACCSPAVRKKLDEIANGVDAHFCYKEPSARVRRMARLAMRGCGPPVFEPPIVPSIEGPPPEGMPPPILLEPEPAPYPEMLVPPPLPGEPIPGEPLPPPPAAASGPELVPPSDATTTVRSTRVKPSSIQQAGSEGDMVVARVNGEPIYRSEILAIVNRRLESVPAAERAEARRTLAERELQLAIDRKVLVQEARAAGEEATPAAHDSVDRGTAEARLAAEWLNKAVPASGTVTKQEIVAWHQSHIDEYQAPEEVRFEQISAPLTRTSSHERLHLAVTYLRERALGSQADPPAEVPLQAVRTEKFGWTRPESVRSKLVAQALSTLPVGQISPVIEDETGIYVVRILEQRGSRPIPAEQVAAEIHEKILRERQARAQAIYLKRLRAQATLWTYHDGNAPEAEAITPVSARQTAPVRSHSENPLFSDQWEPLRRERGR